ncbi:MAG: ferrous iron transport protein B [Kiritimatiellia bacterium]
MTPPEAPAAAPASRPPHQGGGHAHHLTVALVGNPNAGKTTLFNALTGLRAKTSNFPGTTVERKVARVEVAGETLILLDLPGLYNLHGGSPDERVAADSLLGRIHGHPPPDVIVVVVDATNLERNLFLTSQVLELERPVLVALNMIDEADAEGLKLDPDVLRMELGCPVVAVSARDGRGLSDLRVEIAQMTAKVRANERAMPSCKPSCSHCTGCPFQARYDWTEGVSSRATLRAKSIARSERTDRMDALLTTPATGFAIFAAVMLGLFYLIFKVAEIPMALVEGLFGALQTQVGQWLPEGDLRSLVVDGIIGGVGGILVFLPQICILFFLLALLDDTGYLSRAAFLMDRLMRRVGLPGKAFVPLLSAHACAIPAILSTRVIDDRRDRLVTILITPLMTCSARIPVYAMVVGLLFPRDPGKAALVFAGSYATGIVMALVVAFLFKRTILPGEVSPLLIELPNYRLPSLRSAALQMFDRSRVFVKQAGTIILLISIALWALATYPKSEAPPEVAAMALESGRLQEAGRADEAAVVAAAAANLEARHSLEHSCAGRFGRFIEPVFAPLGFDWRISIGVITSFAAREVVVSTLSIVYGLGAEAGADDHVERLYDTLRQAKRPDGSLVFSTATCLSLLVFYILAAQCLPTQAVVRRETGGWKWPLFQIAYMTVLAYVCSLAVYQVLRLAGAG